MVHLINYEKAKKEALKKIKAGKLHVIDLELTGACNANCIYCYNGVNKADKNELTYLEIQNILQNAWQNGIKVLLISGKGEPSLDQKFKSVIEYAVGVGYTVIVFTNGLLITEKLAKILAKNRVSIIIKVDSFLPEIYEKLVGVKGAYKRLLSTLKFFDKYYFKSYNLKGYLALEFVLTRINIEYVKENILFCIEHGYACHIDVLKLTGRGRDSNLVPSNLQIEKFKTVYHELFRKKFEDHMSLKRLSLCVNNIGEIWNGDVFKPLIIGNVRKDEFNVIYNRSIKNRIRELIDENKRLQKNY